MRRLFSNFASGWPALGLLLIRIVAGAFLMVDGIVTLPANQSVMSLILSVLAIGAGAMLIAGLWTPLAGILAATVSIIDVVFRHQNPALGVLLGAMGAGLALVGPGALSIDAWIFGLKKIDLDRLDDESSRR